jgi:hypothetical protein
MTTLLLALTLALGLTRAEQATDPEPAAATPSASATAAQSSASEPGPGTPSPAVEPVATPSGPDAAAKSAGPSALKVTLRIVGLEAAITLLSGWTAVSPKFLGWVEVVSSPFVFGDTADKKGMTIGVAAGMMVAGLGAYNVFELSKAKYTQSDRFWRNFAALHVVCGLALLPELVASPGKAPASTTPQVSLGLTPGGGALLVVGRF